ncbi:hypothetical protein J8J14_05080 [Roseomonas sp. SSH11]|uniref:4-oxalocrotonate decarboxylase n=1 Tax=Pararoseomonas baculiformis TaxID=2820812 RepID=A0ABS4AC63_9PROT|nr:hypothetical protein [Pararoseomonas baculiformis]MBP0444145.1 hypothetical protein [Pararoseomonas baculiformis]
MTRAARAAGWIAEALATGNSLAALPPEVAPRGRAEGERVALAALEALGITPCGVRMLDGMAGPMIEARLLPEGTRAAPLRHPVATAALVGVLAEALQPDDDARPRIAALHIALDIADHRFTEVPVAIGARVADLAGLGFVVVGPAISSLPDLVVVEGRPMGPRDALAPVAAEARRLGGLPAGALLIAAGLSGQIMPREGIVAAGFGALGTVSARLG